MKSAAQSEKTSPIQAAKGAEFHALRRIFGIHAVPIRHLVEDDPAFAGFILGLDRAGIHYLSLAVSYHVPDSRAGRIDLALALRTLSRGKALERVLRRRPPPGLVKLLGRLGSAPLPASHYRSLVALLDEPRARKVLTHASSIGRRLLDGLAHLPPALRIPRLAHLAGRSNECKQIDYALAVARRWRPDLDDAALRTSLKAVREGDDINRWLEHILTRRPFATPPWNGDDQLHPIRDRRELWRVAQRFQNCLAECYLLDATLGRRFYYLWEGEEPCVVEIVPDGLIGWRVGEIEGVGNVAPKSETRSSILARLARNGIHDFGVVGRGFWDVIT